MFGQQTKHRLQGLEAELAAVSRAQAMITLGLDGTILAANPQFLHAMGYTLDEIRGRHHSLFMPATERDSAEYRVFWEQLRRGECCAGAFKRVTKGGREVWWQATYAPVLDAAGHPGKVMKIATDVTQARNESADNAGQLAAMDRSQAVIEFAMDGTILSANDNFRHALGYAAAELVGQNHRMFLQASEREDAGYDAFWSALRRGEYQVAEFKRLAKDGREVWLQASYNPILDSNGKPYKVVKFALDVTEARLVSSNNKGQIDAINRSQAVIAFSLDGTVLSANENFLRAMGYKQEEVVGQHHAMFVDPAERATPEYLAFWQALGTGAFRTGEFRRIRKDGSEVWLRATYNAIYDLNGRPFKVVKFATDITAQVQARGGFSELIETVAAAAHQLSGSIGEISTTMQHSQQTAIQAVSRVEAADDATRQLNAATQEMGRVVDLINSIAGQINMLALNATIESARAGEAGRGFAVVANEVKNLAQQAKQATDEIDQEIRGIRKASADVVGALSSIRQAIDAVSQFVTSTSAAVEEQNTVTGSISANMQTAASRAVQLWAA